MSDLDENLFGGSSDEDDDDDAFYSYDKKDFHKKTRRENDDLLEPSPPKRGRKAHKGASTDDALSKLEHRRERRKASKPSLYDIAAQDSDDSDVEIVAQVAAAKAASATNNNKNNAVDLLDDSSDEETAPAFQVHRHAPVALMQRSGVAKETCDKIAEARSAVFKLKQAQRYHAEDVYIPAAPAAAPFVLTVDAPSPVVQQQQQSTRDLGPSIPLKLRTNRIVNGKRSDSSTMETMTIRRNEPFQKLLQRYQSKHDIVAAESSVKFSVDGDRIDLLKTPAFYDLEQNDIVEVLVTTLMVGRSSSTANGNSSSASAAASTAHLGPLLQLKMRTQAKNGTITNDVMTIRAAEPLQKLMDKYKKTQKVTATTKVTFSFDGETMNLNRTPTSYDMESEDIVDVVCK